MRETARELYRCTLLVPNEEAYRRVADWEWESPSSSMNDARSRIGTKVCVQFAAVQLLAWTMPLISTSRANKESSKIGLLGSDWTQEA